MAVGDVDDVVDEEPVARDLQRVSLATLHPLPDELDLLLLGVRVDEADQRTDDANASASDLPVLRRLDLVDAREDATQQVELEFRSVELRTRRSRVEVPDAGVVVAYVESTRPAYQSLLPSPMRVVTSTLVRLTSRR